LIAAGEVKRSTRLPDGTDFNIETPGGVRRPSPSFLHFAFVAAFQPANAFIHTSEVSQVLALADYQSELSLTGETRRP
jgi:hypothetical protein